MTVQQLEKPRLASSVQSKTLPNFLKNLLQIQRISRIKARWFSGKLLQFSGKSSNRTPVCFCSSVTVFKRIRTQCLTTFTQIDWVPEELANTALTNRLIQCERREIARRYCEAELQRYSRKLQLAKTHLGDTSKESLILAIVGGSTSGQSGEH